MKPWAADPAMSRGRCYSEPGHLGPGDDQRARGPRDDFQRDRDRIIHSISFRRLRHKTQVFMAPDGDHFRVRLTHSIEVAQIGRTIARALGLNEDLTEALCLAHDIGHPPFGHAGEQALKIALASAGGFDHNGHTVRTLALLERPYPLHDGLNLTWETLEGLAKHNGPVSHPGWALRIVDETAHLALGDWPSLEAQVAAIADDIAYDNHDIDDGLRAGLLTLDQLLDVPLVARNWQMAQRRYPGVEVGRLAGELVRGQIGAMVNDVIVETRRRIADTGIETIQGVRAAGQSLAGFSEVMQREERVLKRFMYEKLYHHPFQAASASAAGTIIGSLFSVFHDDPSALPDDWQKRLPDDEPDRSRHVADFIAGMTDRYAINLYRELVGPVDLPDAF